MSLNMKTLTQAFAKASAVIEKTVQSAVQEVTGLPKPMQDYDLIDQIGSAGPGLAWKLYSAKLRDGHAPAVYSTVCVWVLDKKALSEARQRAGLSKAVEDTYLDLIRADASRLVRLRHPGVVHVVQALDESKNAMAMVTEPLFASVANALGDVGNLEKVPKELKGMEMGLLEVKHGLLQVAETLQFLHNNAHLVHRAISPETVLITFNGAWKLGGFCFATSTDQSSNDSLNTQAFHYAEYDVEDSSLPLQPSINYTAPELVRSKSSTVGPSSDVFSLGCLAYHLITRKPLFDCHNNVKMYMNSLAYLTGEMFSAIPWELVPDLQRMLSVNESLRPTASDFTGSSFFREDTRLRALRFLDHMLGRDNMQKTEFLKALSEMWKDFDPRVLRYKVLPPLCAELRNMVLQPMILPMVLKIAESQDQNDFEHSTMPALVPVLNSAASETLLLLVKHAELIINKANAEHLISHILPMLVRAYDDSDPRLQEEVLKRTIPLSRRLDVQLLKQAVLPRVHGLALKTTVAAVRVNALTCFAGMVNLLEKSSVLEILQTIQRCTIVDHSVPTLMSTLSVANAILKQFGIEFVAEHVLPRLIPLLITQQLNTQQFAKYMFFVKDVLRQIEEKRGVTLTNPGIPAVKSMPTIEVYSSGQSNTTRSTSPSTTRRRSSWDEGWLPAKVSSPSVHSSTTKPGVQHPLSSQPTQGNSGYSVSSAVSLSSIQQSSPSCPAVDIEWPPSSGAPVFGGSDKVNGSSMTSSSSLDDVDPFSNWPPRSNATNISSQLNNGSMALSTGDSKTSTPSIGLSSHSSSQAFSFSNSQAKSQIQGTGLTENIFGRSNGPSSGSSLGILNQTSSTSSTHGSSSSDLKSIFASNKNEHGALRLAPPPTTPASRGRGRGRVQGSSAISSTAHQKPHTQQPSLPNLL